MPESFRIFCLMVQNLNEFFCSTQMLSQRDMLTRASWDLTVRFFRARKPYDSDEARGFMLGFADMGSGFNPVDGVVSLGEYEGGLLLTQENIRLMETICRSRPSKQLNFKSIASTIITFHEARILTPDNINRFFISNGGFFNTLWCDSARLIKFLDRYKLLNQSNLDLIMKHIEVLACKGTLKAIDFFLFKSEDQLLQQPEWFKSLVELIAVLPEDCFKRPSRRYPERFDCAPLVAEFAVEVVRPLLEKYSRSLSDGGQNSSGIFAIMQASKEEMVGEFVAKGKPEENNEPGYVLEDKSRSDYSAAPSI
jgi:hypothetical protein